MKEAPNQKVQEKKPLLKFKKYKEKHVSGKNLEKMFSAPTPTLQCLCLIITQLVTNYSRRFSLTSEEMCKLRQIAYLREHVRQISGGNMCHT